MIGKYETERVKNLSLVQEPKKRLADATQDELGFEQYLQTIKKHVAIKQIKPEVLLELINYIEIGKAKR